MSNASANTKSPQNASLANAGELAALTTGLIDGLRGVRELLGARSEALEECRNALVAYRDELAVERTELSRCEQELSALFERREQEIGTREKQLSEAAAAAGDLGRREKEVCEREAANKQVHSEIQQRQTAVERAAAELNQHQQELQRQQAALADERKRFESESRGTLEAAAKLDKQRGEFKAEQETAAANLEKRLAELDRRASELSAREQTLETRMDEIESIQQGLGQMRKQMETELTAIEQQKSDLLPRYGVKDAQPGAEGAADAGLPSPPDRKARESLQRFQKLCRDAKRRVVGAG